ncbi:MAG: helix-turn-helix domain-containing protein [Actinomycetota bacterium]|jgi:transcriptional regulator with XRE-family HTH domain|nr:helix-turn-helix domain-containing protein [Actinomycetota bacterium]
MILVRRLLGDVLRQERLRQGRTLRDISAGAQVSLGYISEIERGQKEASSECLAAICNALDVPLSVVLADVSGEIAREEAAGSRIASLPALASSPSAVQDMAA